MLMRNNKKKLIQKLERLMEVSRRKEMRSYFMNVSWMKTMKKLKITISKLAREKVTSEV